MNIEELPHHIFYKILIYSLSIEECDIEYNLNLKLVSKKWNNEIKKVKFWKDYSKYIYYNLNFNSNERDNIYNHYQNLLNRYLDKIKSEKSQKISQKLFLEKKLFEKENYNQDAIIQHHDFFYIYKHINDDLHQIFNYDLNKIPVCYFKDSNCIDNVCKSGCSINFHGLLNYATNYVMRGVDDKNRFYLLFFYKNNVTNRIHYEFVFPINILHSRLNLQIFTYSGTSDASYIGNLSFIVNSNIPTLIRHFKRELTDISYDYMYRLINFKPCGFVYFDTESEFYVESTRTYQNKPVVELYFNKEEIETQIKNDFYYDS
jgi:hypothetical protein